jgi:hypothetical protein
MTHDDLSASSSHVLCISSKQGRKSDAEIKGRNTNSDREDLDTLWKFYDSSSEHHVSTQDGVDVFMFAEKEYPLRAKTLSAMLKSKLRVYADNEKIRALIQKIRDQYARVDTVLRRTR